MRMPKRQIFDKPPKTWKDLQNYVAQVFTEMGCDVQKEVKVQLPRGSAELDIFVRDVTVIPHANYICECKNWERPVPQSIVHSFRTVVTELGVHRGFLISRAGFQAGAREASRFTNIDLMSWREFEALIFDRWIAGITRKLNPLFAQAYILMNPSNENLWKLRECTAESYEEWDEICRRYSLVGVWALMKSFTDNVLLRLPSIGLTDHGMLVGVENQITFNTYRKIVNFAPMLCRIANAELATFWSGGTAVPPDVGEAFERKPRFSRRALQLGRSFGSRL